MLASITWDVSPDIFNFFGRDVRWYGLCWGLAILTTTWVIQHIFKYEKHPEKWFDSIFIYVVAGLIIGARLGHCLFYDPVFYLTHPLELIKVWEGGLASHGGAIGMTIGIWLYSRRVTKKSMLWAMDRLAVGVPIGAALIRIGNLMNSEVYGKPTDLPWGFNFVRDRSWYLPIDQGGAGELPCHPTQIYEALIYLVVFGVVLYLFYKTNSKQKVGLILGVELIIIFVARFFIEYLKFVQEPFELKMRASIGMDMGQILSLPFIIWGIWLIYNASKEKPIKK